VSAGELGLIAVLTGLGAIIAAVGGVLLAIRAVRSKERKSAAQELAQVSELLDEARTERIAAEARAHDLELALVREGIELPPARPLPELKRRSHEPDGPGGEGAQDAEDRIPSGVPAPRHLRRIRRRSRSSNDDGDAEP
jgi:hypothetical protein